VRRFALALALLLPAAAAADETLVSSGPPDEKLDLVFLGDGYTAAEQNLFRDDVRRFTDHLFSQPPFSTYKDLFNVHRVDVASSQSGADDECAGVSATTAFDTGYRQSGGDCRLLFTASPAKVYAAAARAPGYDPGSGLVAVIVNSTAYGGAATAGGCVVVYRGDSGPEALAHELGHSFGLLADEYEQPGRIYAGGEPSFPNVTIQTDRSLLKWARWISPATPLPTAAPSMGPGLYEGGLVYQYGVFRPTFDSKMRSLNRPYDAVNEALLKARMDAWLPPSVAMTSPAAGARVSGRVTVSARGQDGVGLSRLEFLLDGRTAGGSAVTDRSSAEASWEWDSSGVGAGPHALTVRAVDTAGNATDRTAAVIVDGSGAVTPPSASVRRLLVLSPGLKDGVNDETSVDAEAEEVTIFDMAGRVVYAAPGGAAWDGEGTESGVYVARTKRTDGTTAYRTLMIVR
jgi:hypothetical protein